MVIRPVENIAQFIPVVYLFEVHLLNRSARYDHSVVIIVFHLIKVLIKLIEVTRRRILCLMGTGTHEGNIQLQRCVRQGAQKLQLRILLQRHEIQDHNLQGTDLLQIRLILPHYKNVFPVQNLPCREIILNPYRHLFFPAFLSSFR